VVVRHSLAELPLGADRLELPVAGEERLVEGGEVFERRLAEVVFEMLAVRLASL